MSNLDRGISIDSSCKVSLHLVEWFQRRRLKCEKLTDDSRRTTDDRRRTTEDGRRTPSDGKGSHCLWQGELERIKGQAKSTKH
jgi:hypothetical protein